MSTPVATHVRTLPSVVLKTLFALARKNKKSSGLVPTTVVRFSSLEDLKTMAQLLTKAFDAFDAREKNGFDIALEVFTALSLCTISWGAFQGCRSCNTRRLTKACRLAVL